MRTGEYIQQRLVRTAHPTLFLKLQNKRGQIYYFREWLTDIVRE